jgi:hypothetical protein
VFPQWNLLAAFPSVLKSWSDHKHIQGPNDLAQNLEAVVL